MKDKGKKITIGGLTGAGALIVILLTIYEKTEAIIARAVDSKPATRNTEIVVTGDSPKMFYLTKQAGKK